MEGWDSATNMHIENNANISIPLCEQISLGEELTYDYRYKLLPGEGCPCHCEAPTCRGRLY
jgi:hypothetical protein